MPAGNTGGDPHIRAELEYGQRLGSESAAAARARLLLRGDGGAPRGRGPAARRARRARRRSCTAAVRIAYLSSFFAPFVCGCVSLFGLRDGGLYTLSVYPTTV